MSGYVRKRCSGVSGGAAPAVLALAVSLGITQLWAKDTGSDVDGGEAVAPSAVSPDAEGPGGHKEVQEGALVFNAHLFSGSSGVALEFTVDPWATATKTSGQISDAGSGLRYRYDAIPEMETLPFVSHVNLVSRADTVDVVKGRVSYNKNGLLDEFVLPAGIHVDNSAHLVGAVAKAMDVLVANRADILPLIDDGSTALVVSGASGIVTTFYDMAVPIEPLVEVTVTSQGEETVKVLSDELQRKLAGSGRAAGGEYSKNLNVVGLMVTRKGAVPSAVLQYLKDLMGSVGYKGLRDNFLKLGMGGHGAWGSFKEYMRRVGEHRDLSWLDGAEVYVQGTLRSSLYNDIGLIIHQYEGVPITSLLISSTDDVASVSKIISQTLESIAQEKVQVVASLGNVAEKNMGGGGLYGITAKNITQIQFVVKPDMEKALHKLWLGDTSEKSVMVQLRKIYPDLSDDKIVAKVAVAKKEIQVDHPKANDWSVRGDSVTEYVRANVRAFSAGAIVGGSIGTGVRVFDRYRQDGKLPHKYSQAELVKLAESVVWDSLRGGINGAATMNVMKFARVPAPVASAVIGAGNSIYNTYRDGELNWENAAPVVVRSGVESTVAAAGGWGGGLVTGFVPYGQTMPMQVGGVLTGSLLGHYAYQLAVDKFSDYLPDALASKPKKTVLKLR